MFVQDMFVVVHSTKCCALKSAINKVQIIQQDEFL